MFVARTGLKTRPGTASGNQQSGLTALLAPKRKKKDEKVGFYCWIPFMLRPCIAGFVGLFVLLGGTAMCTVGYYARHLATERTSNGTHTVKDVNEAKRMHINNLTYVGPVVMGCGCFIVVVAFVVVCEYRDKQIRVKREEDKKKQLEKRKKKNAFYDTVKNRLKSSVLYHQKGDKREAQKAIISGTNGGCHASEREGLVNTSNGKHPGKHHNWFPCMSSSQDDPIASERNFEHISKGLVNIPMEIFTLEMDPLSGTASLLPVRSDPIAEIEKYKFGDAQSMTLRKCPSDSCIPHLMKVNETRLDEVFPERRQWSQRCKTVTNLKTKAVPLNSKGRKTPDSPCEVIMLDEKPPQRPVHSANKNTCSNSEDAQDDISVLSRVSSMGKKAKVFAQDLQSSSFELKCDTNGELPDSGSSISDFESKASPDVGNSDYVAMDTTPSQQRVVILHHAAVHSDENGFGDDATLPRLNKNVPSSTMGDRGDAETTEPGSVARENAIGMDTFRRSFSTKSLKGSNQQSTRIASEKQPALTEKETEKSPVTNMCNDVLHY